MSNKQINYYKLDQVGAATMKESTMAQAVKSIQLAMKGATDDLDKLANIVYTDEIISKFLMSLAKMPVFSKDFAMLFQDNLEVLSILKKLKFFVNLKIRETLYLLMKLCVVVDDENAASEVDIDRFFEVSVDSPKANQMIDLKFKTAIRGDDLFNSDQQDKKSEYLQEFDNLEKVEPHAIYPTSIYRQSDGYTVAAEGSQKIEAVMSTTLTTSIRISSHVLGFRNNLLADIYRPIGRAVIVLDDKLDAVNYTSGLVEHDTNKRVVMGMQCGEVNKRNKMMTIREQLERYFTHHGVEVKFLIKSGNEVDKDIKKVQEILIDLKTIGVNRNEPVLVVGGVS